MRARALWRCAQKVTGPVEPEPGNADNRLLRAEIPTMYYAERRGLPDSCRRSCRAALRYCAEICANGGRASASARPRPNIDNN
jgi:hypothetical protein